VRPLWFGALLLAAVFVLAVTLPDWRGDGTYYTASRLLLEGRAGPQMYDDDWMQAEVEAATNGRVSDIFRPNPPTAALLALPVAWLPPDLARRAWTWLNTAVLFAALALCQAEGRRAANSLSLLALAFSLFAAPVVEGFQLGQAYILILGLYALAWWGLRRRRSLVAGLCLALALMLKTSGAPLWLLLAARREWRALGWAALGCLAIFGLSLPWLGPGLWRAYALDVLPMAAASPSAAVTAFQSLPGFWAHLFRADAVWNPSPLVHLPALAGLLSLLSLAAVLGVTLLIARRAPLDLAFGAMAAASVFLVPFAEQHHFTLMALPVLLATHEFGSQGFSRFRLPAPDTSKLGQASEAGGPGKPRLLLVERSLLLDLAWLAVAALLIAVPLPYESPRLAGGAWALLAYPRLYGGLLLWAWLLVRAAQPPPLEVAANA
jgi:hypothetical protein